MKVGKSTVSEFTTRVGSENHVQVAVSVHIRHRHVCGAGRIDATADREEVTVEISKPRDLVVKTARHHDVKESVAVEVADGKPP